jgi:hypothetical protein
MRTNLKKRSFILVLAVLTAITFFTLRSETQAAEAWYTCSVMSVGPGGGSVIIGLSDVNKSFTLKWMYLDAAQTNQLLAVALTAMSLGKNVNAYLDNSLAYPIVKYLMLNNY